MLRTLSASMAVSRSFGDKIHKHPFNGAPDDHMSSRPHIDSMPMKDIEFMIVACDGLWDKFELSQFCFRSFEYYRCNNIDYIFIFAILMLI